MDTLMAVKRTHKEKPTGENCHNAIQPKSNNHYGHPLSGKSGNIISTIKHYKNYVHSVQVSWWLPCFMEATLLELRSALNKECH
jgi:hypothetical protein